jgi:exodeoxyribonuclease VII large subunit
LGQSTFEFQPTRNVYTVSRLTQEVKAWLERQYLSVWVSGEISNFRPAGSGHLYFTLKDENAQLRAVCFRNQARILKFKPQDGMAVIARGQLTVYAPRGEYQLVVEHLEPAGLGALQAAFEQLKQRLAAEGLFEQERKVPLPLLPRTVGVVTSPSGAVIRDILRVLRRRFPNVNILIYPARVQGAEAAQEIAEGIRYFNEQRSADVLIIARGGGSLEDLWPFNEEVVARAIAASSIPLISAVGHETDFTIADFVADLRAPTPSAAAELVVHRKQDFQQELRNRERRMDQMIRVTLSECRERLVHLKLHSTFQTIRQRLQERSQRLDDTAARMERALADRLSSARHQWVRFSTSISRFDLRRLIRLYRSTLAERHQRLNKALEVNLQARRTRLQQAQSMLHERSPLVILNRGYAIARDMAGNVVRDAAQIEAGAILNVRLAKGELESRVIGRKIP